MATIVTANNKLSPGDLVTWAGTWEDSGYGDNAFELTGALGLIVAHLHEYAFYENLVILWDRPMPQYIDELFVKHPLGQWSSRLVRRAK